MPDSFQEVILLPQAREVHPSQGFFALSAETGIRVQGEGAGLPSIAMRIREEIDEVLHAPNGGDAAAAAGDIVLRLEKTSGAPLHPQGYELTVAPRSIRLSAPDEAGLFYAAMTLVQIIRQCASRIPCVHIRDTPDFPVRGVLLDVSRDKVPTLETLLTLIDLLAELKVNQLQFYTEHTFAYSRHREVWANAGPITAEEIQRLDRYCRERFIELVPNQNSFGHLNRWLTLPRYRHLAECPQGFQWPEGDRSRHPFSLDPTNPECIPFLEGLYDELLPNFKSRLFNVGCDETWDLGQGRSAEACRKAGVGRVYLEFLKKIYGLVKSRGKTMQFWGDIVMRHPELVSELPRDSIALEWGYEADHPFAEHSRRFAGSGIPFYVCPGTSSWNSICGRTDNCLVNIRSAAQNGLESGAAGLLNTDWGDEGHWQYLPVSYLGFAAGAAYSWCASAFDESNLVRGLDLHVFKDRAGIMGRLAWDLGNAYNKGDWSIPNNSFIFHLLIHPADRDLPKTVTPASFERTRQAILDASAGLEKARMDRADATVIHDEFANSVRLLLHGVDRGRCILKGTADAPRTLSLFASELRIIIGEYSRLWESRNRIGGLLDSVQGLMHLLELTGENIPSARHSKM